MQERTARSTRRVTPHTDARDTPPGVRPRAARSPGLAALLLALASCTIPQVGTDEAAPEKAPEPPVLSEQGERYLRNIYQAACALEYLPYPPGEGPPVAPRSPAEWSARASELEGCLREKIAGRFTTREAVDLATWNGREHSMSEAEREGIVRFGEEFLEEYVAKLLEGERGRAGQAPGAAVSGTP